MGNVRGELIGIRLQAVFYLFLGHFNHALQLVKDGKELVVQAGLQGGDMESLLMTIEADLYELKTEFSKARCIQEAMLRGTSAILSPIRHGEALLNIAFLDIITGASVGAVSHNLDAAMTLFRNSQYPRGVSLCEYSHADLLLREGNAVVARNEYMRLLAKAHDSDEIRCYCLAKLADPTNLVHTNMEYGRWAVVFLAYALRPQVRSLLMVHQALRRLADVLTEQGADDTALSISTVALDGFTQMDVHQSRAECMRTIGNVYAHRGDLFQAREMWEGARLLFERSEQRKEVARIGEKLQMLGVVQKMNEIPQVEPPNPQAALRESGTDSEKNNLA
jgi:predicted negative regulator of RcsB-dependent stress response